MGVPVLGKAQSGAAECRVRGGPVLRRVRYRYRGIGKGFQDSVNGRQHSARPSRARRYAGVRGARCCERPSGGLAA